ncbi:MAG TPA: hypothetical protein VKG25_03355, partial [Bryobacteraceae bacterium]|nr:hypothetical protein [Bryobacteraceae bacterium]
MPLRCREGVFGLAAAREYDRLVRVKTSALLERAAVLYVARVEREARDRKDLGIIEQNAERLNRHALDTLEYQQTSMKRGEFYHAYL